MKINYAVFLSESILINPTSSTIFLETVSIAGMSFALIKGSIVPDNVAIEFNKF